MIYRYPCAVFLVLVFSVLSTASSETYGQEPDVPPRLNGFETDTDYLWTESWEGSPWTDLIGFMPDELSDDVLTEVVRRSPTPRPFPINRWPVLRPARGLLVGLRARKRHPPYHPVTRFRGATDLSVYDFSNTPTSRASDATERSRSLKERTYSAGELLNLLIVNRKNKDENRSGNGASLRYGLSR